MTTNQEITFDEAIALAKETTGTIPVARLWNMLSTRCRNGEDITDFTTMALVASVVGKAQAPEYVATVQKIWGRK